MDEKLKQEFAQGLRNLATLVERDEVDGLFVVGTVRKGEPTCMVYLEPHATDLLVETMNKELSAMLDAPHHIVWTEKLQKFLFEHGISENDLLSFDFRNASTEH